MKRDMDLVRHILMETEKAEGPLDYEAFLCERWPSLDLVSYHVDMLAAHGLVDANTFLDMNKQFMGGKVFGLTWDGCDFLDAVRSDLVWKRTKDVVAKAVGSTTLEVVKKAATAVSLKLVEAAL